MKKITIFLLVAVFGVTSSAVGQTRSRASELSTLEAALDSYFEELKRDDIAATVPLYVEAKGRIRSVKTLIESKPNSRETNMAFSICSTFVISTNMQFKREFNLMRARQMIAERDSLLMVLHSLHETISRIEGGRAYRLAQALEATQAKAAHLQDDLQAAKVNLAAERERLRQVMEDAQRRFAELQSELISVSTDARGTIITMSDILFDVGRATLTADLRQNLARIAGILMVYREPNILIEGHTDNQGTREFNQKLSEDRASNVVSFLVEQGVTAERLSSIGSAFDKPIADNATHEGRAQNRRVDIIIEERTLLENVMEHIATEEEQRVEEIIGSETPAVMEKTDVEKESAE